MRALTRIPTHMSYNVTALDDAGRFATLYLAPDREAIVTSAPVATNHQERIDWVQHARATATVERERYILQRLLRRKTAQDSFIDAFLRPPLYALGYSHGNGTLYTAAYWPQRRSASYVRPGVEWRLGLDGFSGGTRRLLYPLAAKPTARSGAGDRDRGPPRAARTGKNGHGLRPLRGREAGAQVLDEQADHPQLRRAAPGDHRERRHIA